MPARRWQVHASWTCLPALANDLDAVGRAYLGQGMLAEARLAFEEGLSQDVMSWTTPVFLKFGLGLVALAEGHNEEAISCFQLVVDAFDPLKPVVNAALGAAYLALGDRQKALAHTTTAVSILEARPAVNEYPAQEVWWHHYQVLQTADPETSFAALDKAKQVMMAAIETLSDEGLRRNYLNKVAVNRQITLAWAVEAAQRDISLDPFTAHEPLSGSLREQFRRAVDIGTRLTAQHDPSSLAGFIVQEFVEMSGAERALLLRLDQDLPHTAAAYNPEDALELLEPLLDTLRHSRQPLLRQIAGRVPQGELPEIHGRSLVALPLNAQGRLLGVLYGDMRQIFGRFDDSDVRLLSMLANQAAAALNNAALVTTLEEKVAERTADLVERNNELAIINSVQEGLVAELDLQAIFDLVGDQIYEISQAQMVAICTFDFETNTVQTRYDIEDGRRLESPDREIDPDTWDFIKDPRSFYLPTLEEIVRFFGPEILDKVPKGTAVSSSILYIPMMVGENMVGYIDLQDERPFAFSESDIRLMATLARSMSVSLENARLYRDAREARAQAEEANESKSRFLSSMSHELRTPLNAIIGFTRIVQRKTRGTIPEKQTDNLEKVKASAEHLLGLINTVLDIAKIEAGRMDVVNEPFAVRPLVELCASVAKPLFRPGVGLDLAIAADLPSIVSDTDKVKQILLNLLSNAAKFTHEGTITVSARLAALRHPPVGAVREPPLLQIDVADTGIGMNEEQLARVFEEFQQAEETTSKQYGGTGLGLPISRQLAQLLGGDLSAASRPGQGSTFTLRLPLSADSGPHNPGSKKTEQ